MAETSLNILEDGTTVWRRDPSIYPAENAFDLVVRRPDGLTIVVGINYSLLESLGDGLDQWLLETAKQEATLKRPKPPVQPQKPREKRFPAKGVSAILIQSALGTDTYFRIYSNDHPGGFKDYRLFSGVDPTVTIEDSGFEFVEREDGKCYFDFSEQVLGRKKK